MKFILSLAALLATATIFAQKGTLSGTLTDKDVNNEPLPFANVILKGTNVSTVTDETGNYKLQAEAGNYIVQFSFLGYETVELPVRIIANETVVVSRAIGSGSYTLEDVKIQAAASREKETALLVDQKNAVEIKQSIGAQEMSRKGVGDVEEGLTKITGITKVGSRGLFVRGLEDRYNNLLINDLAAPTNNPFKKIIPLDLFPTDIVAVIEVYKTFNPNIYGDFAGGTFDILTSKGGRSVTRIGLSAGFISNSSLEDFTITKDAKGAKGFFGLTGKDRELPGAFGNIPAGLTIAGQAAVDAFDENGFDAENMKTPLNTGVSFLHSERFNIKNNKFSYLLSINGENGYYIRKGVDRTVNSAFEFSNDFITTDYLYKTSLSSLIGLNYKTDRADITFNTMYLRTTESLIKDQFGVQGNLTNNPNFLLRTNQLDQSDYLNGQLFGEYAITSNKRNMLKAGISYARTSYQQPDRKFFGGTKQPDGSIIASYGGNNFIRQYLDIEGSYFYSGLAEYNFKFGKNEDRLHAITLGYNGNTNATESSYRFASTNYLNGPGNFTVALNEVDTQLETDLLAGNFIYRETTNSQYKVFLKEFAHAGYANILYKWNSKGEINAGVRFETTNRETIYKPQGSFTDPYTPINYEKQYILPSLNVKYAVTEKANVRFASGLTYTKPVIMESYPIEYVNADGTVVKGNPFLVNSDNINVDLKFEIFPTNKEMFAIGLFGKQLDEPIERTFEANAANGFITTFRNSDQAVLYGAELEFILDLGRISKKFSAFSWGFNTSLMQTEAEVKAYYTDADGTLKQSIETHQKRALQGASKWLINSDLKYQFSFSEKWTNTVSLVYAVFGKRIYSVGTAGLDHIYELPVHQLDFVWGSKLSEHFDIKLSADNLLNPARRLELGDDNKQPLQESTRLLNSYKRGVGVSISIGYTF